MQPFWAALQRGEFIADAAVVADTYRKQGTRWVAACGGVRPRRGRNLEGRCLTFAEREEIALVRARGKTISRELRRNAVTTKLVRCRRVAGWTAECRQATMWKSTCSAPGHQS